MTVQTKLIGANSSGINSKVAAPAVGLSPDIQDIVTLRRDRWLDGPESAGLADAGDRNWSERETDLAWERLARQRFGIGMAFVDVANGVAYAIDVDSDVLLYRVVTSRAADRHLNLAQLIEFGEVAVARFVANGILEWLPLSAARNLQQARQNALRLGATPLRRLFALIPLKTAGGIRLASTGGAEALTLDLVPPNVGAQIYPHARRFAWNEVDAPMSYGFGTPAAEQMPAGLAALFSQPWQ
ncbi:hypothetical protein [Dongia sp.]|uniref:hypothetical protein n=1 Tax=Dongia sp. TaxID=1977262 RepID=UPI0035B3FE74